MNDPNLYMGSRPIHRLITQGIGFLHTLHHFFQNSGISNTNMV
jgi:hypothetical protein